MLYAGVNPLAVLLYAGLAVASLVLGVYFLLTDPPEDGPLRGLDVEAMAEDNPVLDADALGGEDPAEDAPDDGDDEPSG